MDVKRKSFRDRYFEDYTARRKELPNGKTTVEYVYSGTWYRWGMDGFSFPQRRLTYFALELVGAVFYVLAAMQTVPLNVSPLAAGFGTVSLVPWALEIWGVVSFGLSKTYITELDFKAIDFRLSMGAFLRLIFLLASLGCGVVQSIREGVMDGTSWLALVFYLLSAASSAVVCRLQTKQGFRTYRNEEGKVGDEF